MRETNFRREPTAGVSLPVRNVDGESLAWSWRLISTPQEFSPDRSVNFPVGEDFGSHNDIGATVDLVDYNIFDSQ